MDSFKKVHKAVLFCLLVLSFLTNQASAFSISREFLTKEERLLVNNLLREAPNSFDYTPPLHANLSSIYSLEKTIFEDFAKYLIYKNENSLLSEFQIINDLWIEVYDSLYEYEQFVSLNCERKTDSAHHKKWISNMISVFGKNYLNKNISYVKDIILYLSLKNAYECGYKHRVSMIYREIEYVAYSAEFYTRFVQFLNENDYHFHSTDLSSRKELNSIINIYLNILDKRSLFKYSYSVDYHKKKAKLPKNMDEVSDFLDKIEYLKYPFFVLDVNSNIDTMLE